MFTGQIVRTLAAELACAVVVALMVPSVGGADGSEEQEYESAMKELEKGITRQEITEGSFRQISVGHEKKKVVSELRSMDVRFVMPDLLVPIEVTRAAELNRLASAEGLIVGSGDVVVSFAGDEVERVLIAPIFSEWKPLLQNALTRAAVFEGLAQILDRHPDVIVRSLAPDARHVNLEALTPQDMWLLNKYDLWEASHDDREGYWIFRLEFKHSRLQKITVQHSPVEFP